jgi:hypothetical protein
MENKYLCIIKHNRMTHIKKKLLYVVLDSFLEAQNLCLYIDWYLHKLCVQNKYSSFE